ncbi:MAG: glycosyltransferase family 9 protein [Candidatus Omnitrophica bacterium]|nr:glycosyltransferase family 9 protein [Candidatus Omnitrophota bacterium]
MAKRILIISPFGIGDVLFSTPLVSAIKEKYSGSNIAYICNIRTQEILETNPEIDEVFVFERDEYRELWKRSKIETLKKLCHFWGEIKKRRFDLLLDLSLGKEYAFFSWLIGIKERRGFNYKGRGRFLTHRIVFEGFHDKPVAEYYSSLIEVAQGSRLKAQGKTVLVTTDKNKDRVYDFLRKAGIKEEHTLVGIAPGGGASYGKEKAHYKRWAPEKFALLSDRIASCNLRPILIGGPEEKGLVKDVALKMQNKPLIAPDMKIREMACLIKKCRAIICNDGGLLHIAVSQDTTTVSIFGPTDEKVYGPYPPSKKHVVIKSKIDCRPCYKRFKLPECNTVKCMGDISVETVFSTFKKLTEEK